MADTCTTTPNSNRHSSNNDVTPCKRLPQHKVEPSTSSGEKLGGIISIDCCTDPSSCMTLFDILKSFNAPVSEEQMWALIYQSVKLYRDAFQHRGNNFKDLRVPVSTHNLNIHRDGSVHVSFQSNGHMSKAKPCWPFHDPTRPSPQQIPCETVAQPTPQPVMYNVL
ncbi:Protein spire [Pseudolycoriella hygida]|uniref:Protein spire n=1 Tax=Pseudolycoriella hygida TaxID=35572 RepID=A0A9Q0S5F4_9DIPT|nr:Protein spire [Pseudolycoriella hygida]